MHDTVLKWLGVLDSWSTFMTSFTTLFSLFRHIKIWREEKLKRFFERVTNGIFKLMHGKYMEQLFGTLDLVELLVSRECTAGPLYYTMQQWFAL